MTCFSDTQSIWWVLLVQWGGVQAEWQFYWDISGTYYNSKLLKELTGQGTREVKALCGAWGWRKTALWMFTSSLQVFTPALGSTWRGETSETLQREGSAGIGAQRSCHRMWSTERWWGLAQRGWRDFTEYSGKKAKVSR